MILKTIKELKKMLLKEYPHSQSDLENIFDITLNRFLKEKTMITLLNRNYSIENRMSIVRDSVKQSIDVPIYKESVAGILSERAGLTTNKVGKKRYYLIGYNEPFIYLEE